MADGIPWGSATEFTPLVSTHVEGARLETLFFLLQIREAQHSCTPNLSNPGKSPSNAGWPYPRDGRRAEISQALTNCNRVNQRFSNLPPILLVFSTIKSAEHRISVLDQRADRSRATGTRNRIYLRYRPVTRSPSLLDGFVNRLQDSQFPSFLLCKLRGLSSYPDGTFAHCSCQPSLDAHFSLPIRMSQSSYSRIADNCRQCSCSLVVEVSPAEPPQTKGAKISRYSGGLVVS